MKKKRTFTQLFFLRTLLFLQENICIMNFHNNCLWVYENYRGGIERRPQHTFSANIWGAIVEHNLAGYYYLPNRLDGTK